MTVRPPSAGCLLVATPGMGDPNFAQTVILLVEHDGDGTVGVVLNRPSEVTVPSLLAALGPLTATPSVVFAGGPVQRDGVLGLGRCAETTAVARTVLRGVGVVDLDADPLQLEVEVMELRLFAGCSGWSPGQLEDEISAGGWFVVPATPDDVFSTDPEALWATVLRRQGGVFTAASADPSQN